MTDVSEETRLRDGIKKAVFELRLIHHPVSVTAEHNKFICPTCALSDDDAYGEWPCHSREITDSLRALIQDGSDGDD